MLCTEFLDGFLLFLIVLESLFRSNFTKNSSFFKKGGADFFNQCLNWANKNINLNNFQKSRLQPNAFTSILNIGFLASAQHVKICTRIDVRPHCSEARIWLDNTKREALSSTVLDIFTIFFSCWLLMAKFGLWDYLVFLHGCAIFSSYFW